MPKTPPRPGMAAQPAASLQRLVAALPDGADSRSLAVLRVGLALVLLVSLVQSWLNVGAFYGPHGLLPPTALPQSLGAHGWTLFAANPHLAWAQTLLLVQCLLALALLAGWRTRLASLLSWLLLTSLLARNPLVVGDGERLLALLLLWSGFLPLGRHWSVDAALSGGARPPAKARLAASWALRLQLASALFLGMLATSTSAWTSAFASPAGAGALGHALARHPGLATLVVHLLQIIGLAAPWLLLAPLRWLRLAAGTGLAGLLLAQLALLNLGIAPVVALVGLGGLLPMRLWQKAEARLGLGRGLRLYLDRDCTGCAVLAALLREFLILPRCEIRVAQDDRRAETLRRANDSWVLIDASERAHLHGAVLSELCAASAWAWPLAPLLRLTLARRRLATWFKRLRPRLPIRVRRHAREATASGIHRLLTALLVVVLVGQWSAAGVLPHWLHRGLHPVLAPLWLDPGWTQALQAAGDRVLVAPARLADEQEADLLRPGRPLAFRHLAPSPYLASSRWRLYLNRLPDDAALRTRWADYACHHWNRHHAAARRLLQLRLVTLEHTAEGREQRLLVLHDCPSGPGGSS